MGEDATSELAGVAFSASAGRVLPLYEYIRRHVPAARTILDIGCGDGALLRELSQTYRGAQCVGIDVSPRNTRAREGNIELVCADYRAWQCEQQFDLVVAGSVLHLLAMPDSVLLRKLSAHVATGGWLVYDLPIVTLRNRLNAAVRLGLRAIRSRFTDAAIKGIGRVVYRRSFDPEFIEQRLAYAYLPPQRYEDQFGIGLAHSGLRLIAAEDVPHQSIVEMRALRIVRYSG